MKRYAENRLTAYQISNYGMPGRLIAWLMPVLIIAILLLVDTSLTFAETASDAAPAQTSAAASEGASLSAAGDASPADALAGEGSSQDVTIHFGKGKNRSISIHVNPKNSEEEMESESETENTGLEKVEAGDLVTISSVDGSLLPEEAEASAEILSGRAENKAVEKVEEVSVVEPVVAEPDSDAADSAGSIVQDRKKEESSGAKSASKEESSAEAAAVEKTEYQVFDISLEHVDEEQYQDGFKVEVSLPEDVKGRDFRLYHIHEGEEPVEIPVRTVGTVDSETGLEVVSGFEFQTDGFSEFVLKYTVDFEYNDPETGEPVYMSVDGGNTYVLADVLKVLGLDMPNENIAEARFTNNNVLRFYTREDGVWMMESLAPFTTHEVLTIVTQKGNEYTVYVTDAVEALDVNPYITGFSLTDKDGNPIEQDSDGNYIVKDSNNYSYKLHMRWAESVGKQFDISEIVNDEEGNPSVHRYIPTLEYTIPNGVTLKGSGTFEMRVGANIIHGNTYKVENGKVIINFNEHDPNYTPLLRSSSLWLELDFDLEFSSEAGEVQFSAGGEGTIHYKKDTTHDAWVDKSATYNPETGIIEYTIDVHSTGVSKNINVRDEIHGSALSDIRPDTMSVVLYNSSNQKVAEWSAPGNYTVNAGVTKGFDYTITDEIGDGQYARIKYQVQVDYTKIAKNGNATYDETGNKVRIEVPGDENPSNNEDTEVKQDINFSSMKKTSTSTSEVYEKDGRQYRDISYTLEVNPECKVSLTGTTISDSILTTSLMKYKEEVEWKVTDKNGSVIRQSGENDKITIPENATSWSYTVPDTDKAYKYFFTYKTTVDVTGWTQSQAVKNAATFKYGGDGTTTNVPPKIDVDVTPKAVINKYATGANDRTITWKITIDVPAEGADLKSIIERVPSQGALGISDFVTRENITFDGLTDDELAYINLADSVVIVPRVQSWGDKTVSEDKATPSFPAGSVVSDLGTDHVIFNFYYTKDGVKTPGFAPTDSNRTVTITMVTENHPWWMEYAATNSWAAPHTNVVSIGNGEGTVSHGTDVISPTSPSLRKKHDRKGVYKYWDGVTVDSYGNPVVIEMPFFRFEVIATGVQGDELKLTETFDTRYFRLFTGDHYAYNSPPDGGTCLYNMLWFSDKDYNWTNYTNASGAAVHGDVEYTSSGATITFNPIAKDGDANYGYYRVVYYLVPKDEEAFKALQTLAAQQGTVVSTANGYTSKKYKFNNGVSWNGLNSEAKFEYEITDVIKKEGTSASIDGISGLVKYTITYNKNKAKLNNGGKVELNDLLVNAVPYKMNVDGYFSITTDPAANNPGFVIVDDMFDYVTDRGNTRKAAPDGYTGMIVHYDGLTKEFSSIENIPDETMVTITYWAQPYYTVISDVQNKDDYGRAVAETANTASVGDFNYTVTNRQRFSVLRKDSDVDSNNHTASYTINFNDGSLLLNGGVDIDLVDKVSGIIIDESTITVTATPNTISHKTTASAGAETISNVAQYILDNMTKTDTDAEAGNATYTFKVPDGVHVTITYTGKPVYTLDQGGHLSADFTNEVKGENIIRETHDTDSTEILVKTFSDYVLPTVTTDLYPGTIPFTIVFNPSRERLNNGKVMELTDEFENLAVEYSSIRIETIPAGRTVTYDYSGNKGYYKVPDETAVKLTYRAIPIFDANDTATWHNTVKVKGYSADTHDTLKYDSEVHGGGDEVYIYLFKYEKGNMANGLNGVTFTLYKQDEHGNFVPEKNELGKNVTYTTKNVNGKGDGYVKIESTNEFILLENTRYYLHEEGNPDNFYPDDTYYSFRIVKGNSDYSTYSYRIGDTLKIYNTPVTGNISAHKVWENAAGTSIWPENYNDTIRFELVLYNTKSKEEKPVAKPAHYYTDQKPIPDNQKDLAYLENEANYAAWDQSEKTVSKDEPEAVWEHVDAISEALATAGWVYKVKEIGENDGSITLGGKTYSVSGGVVYQGATSIINTENKSGSVKVTKAFSGIPNLPAGFKITATWQEDGTDKSRKLTLSTEGVTGTGTTLDPYTWTIDNLPLGTLVTFTESGATVDGATLTITANGTAVAEGSTTATAKATSAKVEVDGKYPTATFVNEYEQTTGFEFSKIWKDIGNQPTTWPDGATIEVTLNAYTSDAPNEKAINDLVVTLTKDGAEHASPAWTAETSADGKKTTFKVKGLAKYNSDNKELNYYIVESQVNGYQAPSYQTKSGEGLVFNQGETARAVNGQIVVNTPEGGYELPATGGEGRLRICLMGIELIVLAGAGLILTRRHRQGLR